MSTEAKIVINGVELSEGQAMTVRVAIESFAMELATNGLGEDEHDQRMTKAYLQNIGEIRKSLYLGDQHASRSI